MDGEFFNEMINLFNRFIDDLDERMYVALQKEGDVILQAPDFVIRLLVQSMGRTYCMNPTMNTAGHLVFRGLKIYPSYELAIVLFHKDYPLYREEWMIKKISLEAPITLKKEWYTETVFKMKEFFGMRGNNVSDN